MKKKKEKNKPGFDFTVNALNYTQICALEHTKEFLEIMKDPIAFAKELIKGLPVDNLCGEMLDPYIRSIVLHEISSARRAITDHYDPINRILASAACDISKATRRRDALLQDRERLLKEIEGLKRKRDEFNA